MLTTLVNAVYSKLIMFSKTVESKLKKLDMYPKMPKDLTEPTLSGAIVSIVACALMGFLFLTELAAYLNVTTTSEMFVDLNRGGEKLTINIDITFPKFPCGLLSLDAQDIMGAHVVNVEGSMKKFRLNSSGDQLQEEDLLKGKARSDDEIRKQVTDEEGCRIQGYILVNKVPGNFHISSHAFHHRMAQLIKNDMGKLDLSHQINHLSFGDNEDIHFIKSNFDEGVLNPLDSVSKVRPGDVKAPISYEYYLKVVPTTYRTLSNKEFYVHQFTANSNDFRSGGMPAMYFRYDLSPVTVKFSQEQESFFHFLVQVCAIVGGVFTVAGLLEHLLHSSISSILSKGRQGKLG